MADSSPYEALVAGPLASIVEGLVRAIMRRVKLEIRTSVPGQIVAYDPSTNRAVVQVDQLPVVRVRDLTRQPTSALVPATPVNDEATLQPIQLSGIPVYQPSTSTGRFTLALVPGDTGMLQVSDRAMENWLLKGMPSDPGLAATHQLKDSVFYPCRLPTTKPFTPPIDPTATVIDGTQIKLGPVAVESVTKAESLLLALIQAVTAAPVGSMDGGATFKAGLITQLSAITAAQIGSPKAKVE